MYLVQNITNDPLQSMTLILPNGDQCVLQIYYINQQIGWFITNLNYNNSSFVLTGIRIVNSPNLLNQWQNVIPFGIACVPSSNREPMFIDDFQEGVCTLYILDSSEVETYNNYLKNGQSF